MKAHLLRVTLVVALVILGSFAGFGAEGKADATTLCFDRTPTIIAQDGVVTNGTHGNDVIIGTSGDDMIHGNGGDDRICDYSGVNTIYGGFGKDQIEASGTINGDSGNDHIFAVPGTTEIRAGSGNDVIEVPSGVLSVDDIQAGSGNDRVYGGVAKHIDGYTGNDWIEVDVAHVISCDSGRDFGLAESWPDAVYESCEKPSRREVVP